MKKMKIYLLTITCITCFTCSRYEEVEQTWQKGEARRKSYMIFAPRLDNTSVVISTSIQAKKKSSISSACQSL
ncbi:MAG: hypothetical protein C0602_11375 [Denitrovibrio sp.]|nr:MAG: hypothetical protein C0602_11375 [Denitrovibrio sp.]